MHSNMTTKESTISSTTISNFTNNTTIPNLHNTTDNTITDNTTTNTTTTTTLIITRPDFIDSNNDNHHKDFASGHAIKEGLRNSLKKHPIDTKLNDETPSTLTTTTTTTSDQLNKTNNPVVTTLNNNTETANNNTETTNNNTETANNNTETNNTATTNNNTETANNNTATIYNNATTNNNITINNELNKNHINDSNNSTHNNNNTIKTSDNNNKMTSSDKNNNNIPNNNTESPTTTTEPSTSLPSTQPDTNQKHNNGIRDKNTATKAFHPPTITPTTAITHSTNTETRSEQQHQPTSTTAPLIDNRTNNNTIKNHNSTTIVKHLNKANINQTNVNNTISNMSINTSVNKSGNTSVNKSGNKSGNKSSNSVSVIGCVDWTEGVSNYLTFVNIPYFTGYASISLVIFIINILLVIANKMSPKIGVYKLLSDSQYNHTNQTQLTNTMLLMTPCRLFVARIAICTYHLCHSSIEVVFAGVYLVMLWSVPGVTLTTALVVWGVMWIWCFLGKLTCLLLTHTFTANTLNIIGLVAFFLSSVSFYPILHHPFSLSIPCLPLAFVLFSNSFFFSFIDPSIIHHYNKLNLIPALHITQALSNFLGELIVPTIVTFFVLRSAVSDFFFHALTITSAALLLSFLLIHLTFRPFIFPNKQSPKNKKARKMGYKKQRMVNTAWFDNGGVDDDDDDDDDEQDEFVRSNNCLNMTNSPSKPLLLD